MLAFQSSVHNIHPVFTRANPNLVKPTPYVRVGKRIFDVMVASFVLIFILSWMIPLVGLVICLTSKGPLFYRQRRTGQNGRIFWCLKFRTMHHNPVADFAQCVKNDPRVTTIGCILRRTNLDEMPQFLNVLRGNMSVVGPRPHAVEHDDRYWDTIPNYHHRYLVRPGITGLAQVRGARGETDAVAKMRHRMQYDVLYVKRQSLLLDMKLCMATVKTMLTGSINAW